MSSKKYHSEPLPPMQEVDLNDAAWDEVVQHALTRQSGSASAPIEGVETEARGAQRARSVTRVVGVRQLPVLLQRIGRMGGAQRHWLAV